MARIYICFVTSNISTHLKQKIRSVDLAFTGIFTAFVAAATMTLSVFIAATGGFFNIGEIMVYTTALLMGPIIGAFAAGVGSMIADVSLGYAVFAPGTLIIKGAEAFIVGYVSRHRPSGLTKTNWRILSAVTGFIIGLAIWLLGTSLYVGKMELSLGLPGIGYTNLNLFVPELLWMILAVVAVIVTLVVGFSVEAEVGWWIISIILGGIIMVTGYFLYETLILGQVGAILEIPFNFMQLTIGLIVSIPLYKSVLRILPKYRISKLD